jgi:integrative and conjugative element protein (TIGR02256 family)
MQQVVWLPRSAIEDMRLDADQWYDKETGGTFMGYWAESHIAVVTAVIPAGPKAKHERNSFLPDQDWQQAEIAKHYHQSSRLDTYLGDWHTHPNAVSGRLSWTDRTCIKNVIRTPAARNSTPIMMLMCGKPANWALHAWICELKPRFLIFEGVWENEAEIAPYG